MRSARMLLATGAVSAVLALGAPAAHAYGGGDGGHQDSSSSSDSSSYTKDHDPGSHGKPHGGMHTGGGALTAVKQDDGARDPKFDPNTYKDSGSGSGSWGGSDSWGSDHDKPHGGMHTGGGALADPGVSTGGLAVLALAGAGLYAARRRKTAAGRV